MKNHTPQESSQNTLSKVKSDLISVGVIEPSRLKILSTKTRDNPSLNVFQDSVSKVIFIEDYYVGNEEYESGEYRKIPKPLTNVANRDYEDLTDSERRFSQYRQFIIAKNVCDFGCGAGSFLRKAKAVANSVYGIELQKNFSDALNKEGISCYSSLEKIKNKLDVITLFHCFEHLPTPIDTLKSLRNHLKAEGGTLIIEVPHARDFLIENLKLQSFIDFTLWSQHLVLHTRESLNALLSAAGFQNISIEGVQRYHLSNHLHWLTKNRPGGHKSTISVIDTENLKNAYALALSKIDANDTLVAIATN
jgi:2-polyprenyl-3-methyl-5-hydroxy-6-metoxy-1,4-benzoquinol methylase